jgi:peptidoglycan/xylan/chitin deacetylase (PgdA/CDA1 family)
MTDVLVLCYHALSPTWESELSLTPETFEYQVRHLLDRGWHPTTFAAAVLEPPASRTLAITFDDAFASVKRYAAPVLARLGAPATIFAPTAFIGGRPLSWAGLDTWQDTPDAGELDAMTWDDLGALAKLGWEIGSHTQTHPRLTELSAPDLERELVESRDECSRILGVACRSIAYPYGDVDARVADAARRVGYCAGAALPSRLERLGPYRYPRVAIYRHDASWRFRLKAARPVRELRASKLWLLRSPAPPTSSNATPTPSGVRDSSASPTPGR